jgi:hypothetical protein
MTDGLPVQSTEKLAFHLQLAQSLQLHITSKQETSEHIIIEGHDISTLLDYLYDNRELVYDATHDQEMRLLEAREASHEPIDAGLKTWEVERIFYVDDGVKRTRI